MKGLIVNSILIIIVVSGTYFTLFYIDPQKLSIVNFCQEQNESFITLMTQDSTTYCSKEFIGYTSKESTLCSTSFFDDFDFCSCEIEGSKDNWKLTSCYDDFDRYVGEYYDLKNGVLKCSICGSGLETPHESFECVSKCGSRL